MRAQAKAGRGCKRCGVLSHLASKTCEALCHSIPRCSVCHVGPVYAEGLCFECQGDAPRLDGMEGGMAQWITGDRLTADDRRDVLARFVYRMTFEARRQWPEAERQMLAGGWRMETLTDAQWLSSTTFAVRKDGRLDRRINHCSAGYQTNGKRAPEAR